VLRWISQNQLCSAGLAKTRWAPLKYQKPDELRWISKNPLRSAGLAKTRCALLD